MAGPNPCERMRADPIFQRLLAVVRAEMCGGCERQDLSHHTSASCQAEGAPLHSLKACGIDTAIVTASGVCVHLSMPNFLAAGDGVRVVYESAAFPAHADAKRAAVQEYLCLLLGVGPREVMLPPKCFADGARSVGLIREAAMIAHDARERAAFDAWAWAAGPRQTAYRGPPPPPPAGRASQYTAPGVQAERDQLIIDTLMSWRAPRASFFNASLLARYQYKFVDAHIPQ